MIKSFFLEGKVDRIGKVGKDMPSCNLLYEPCFQIWRGNKMFFVLLCHYHAKDLSCSPFWKLVSDHYVPVDYLA